ncbi:hypothetical protein FDP41_006267 [Naegleria fowleri]|uniref:BCNT-C domain-containing protein n=1 Tax=Naegleria fowleri TaxID=5763 RepID=A0A6A5B9C8_NAEFO|nr:uncharacterized protein FDP41_006267 [Naegleria fowleri]KAF0974793.1 hypothetical protein FDP41_006267 [Naegleria fowleri]CAG4712666.1 unnamed protein product [Naegleria fowleri]
MPSRHYDVNENDLSGFAFIDHPSDDDDIDPIFDGIEKSESFKQQEEENQLKKKRKIKETLNYYQSLKKQVIEKPTIKNVIHLELDESLLLANEPSTPSMVTHDRGDEEFNLIQSDQEEDETNIPTTTTTSKSVPISKLDQALAKINEKKKTTISQSKEDWKQFKKQEGIEHELQQYRKDGYLEKQAFLERTEMREFEIEKDLRNLERKRKEQQLK